MDVNRIFFFSPRDVVFFFEIFFLVSIPCTWGLKISEKEIERIRKRQARAP